MKKIVKQILAILVCATVFNEAYADDGGGGSAFSGGSSLGGDSSFGSADMSSNDSGNNSQSSVLVPPISGLSTDNASGNNGQLNLNNNQVLYGANGQGPNPYRSAQSLDGGTDIYRTASGAIGGGSQDNLWQNYANMGSSAGGSQQTSLGGALFVPSVLGSGYVLNPLMQQQDPFQKNVQIRSGLYLPVFGYNLFRIPSTFAPINSTPVDANYSLGPGDQVTLQAWGSMNVNYSVPVDKDGTIFIPKVGKVPVVGVKAANLDSYLKQRISKNYRNFELSATVSQIRSIQVNVAGFAARPGTYQLSSLSTLSNAVFAVGGPSNAGSLRHIQVKRQGRVVADFDLYDVILSGDSSKDIRLLPGDAIYFAPRGNQVAIYDGVKVPGIYEAKVNDTVQNIVNFAGGFNYNVDKNQVIIETMRPDQTLAANNYFLEQGLRRAINNGDIIHFFSLNNVYESSIVLMGNVAEPSRFAYKSGMKVNDIIKNKEQLLTKSFWNSYSYNTSGRDNLLTQIGREKTNEQINADSTSMYSTGLNSGSATGNDKKIFGVSDNLFTAGPLQIPEANINWNYATVIRMNKDTYSMNVIPFNLRKALQGDESNNITLRPGDVIDVFSSKDVRTPSSTSTIYVFLDGEVNAPGVYEMRPGDTILNAIEKAGGLSANAYLYGTQLNRESVKKKQQVIMNQMLDQLQQTLLGQVSNSSASAGGTTQIAIQNQILSQQQGFIAKMRQIKPTGRVVLGVSDSNVDLAHMPPIAVENGDTIYIPTRPSTIDVIGQVYNPASFMYKSGTTVKQYINMSGSENQFADTSNEYILRADGTIYSNQQAGWFGGFANRVLSPGDAIIVPQQIQFGGTVQNLLNWTQILANFGTAAAAITVFKN